MISHIDLDDLPLLATASQFPVDPHMWSCKDPHRLDILVSMILGKGLLGLNLPSIRLLQINDNYFALVNPFVPSQATITA